MVGSTPPRGFGSAALRCCDVPVGARFGRIHRAQFADPLGFGKAPSRFSDPRRRIAGNRYGVLYLGESLRVCFLEALLRDQRDGLIDDLPIAEAELYDRQFAQIVVTAALTMVDLRDDGAVIMGIPSDVAKATNQRLARAWGLAFHEHPAEPDGIVYPSRLNGQTNLAVFDRAIAKLAVVATMPLISAPGLATVLDDLRVAIIPGRRER